MDFSAYRSKCTIIDLSNPTQTYFFEPKTAISLHLSSSTISSREFAFSRNLNQFYVNELNFLVENNIEHLKNKKENKTFFLKHSRGIGLCADLASGNQVVWVWGHQIRCPPSIARFCISIFFLILWSI